MKPRILVVDDDTALAEMLTIVLRQEGFESRMVTRGDLALDEFRAFRPDVVLLDLMLPGKDGIDVGASGGAVRGDHHALATGKAIVFDYKLWAEAVERGLNVFLGRTWA